MSGLPFPFLLSISQNRLQNYKKFSTYANKIGTRANFSAKKSIFTHFFSICAHKYAIFFVILHREIIASILYPLKRECKHQARYLQTKDQYEASKRQIGGIAYHTTYYIYIIYNIYPVILINIRKNVEYFNFKQI